MSEEHIKKLREQAAQFRGLRKILAESGDFESMLQATVCEGLAEVAEGLIEIITEKKKGTSKRPYIEIP